MPRILEPTAPHVIEAAERLRAGAVAVFPTETVYGLGVDLLNVAALEDMYALKGRPSDNPVIAHVLDADHARPLVRAWDDRCAVLTARYWPGPLTLVLPKSDRVPDRATAGRSTVALRAPRHPVARALLTSFAGPIAAPSANRSGSVSPTSAAHVADDYRGVEDLVILDGGSCPLGLESTVLDLSTTPARVLRPGFVSAPELAEQLGELSTEVIASQDASPGTAPRHYAPTTPAELVDPQLLELHLSSLEEPAAVICFAGHTIPPPHQAIVMPEGAGAYAQRIYDALRCADAQQLPRIVIELPPLSNELWRAIHDRLNRATAPHMS